MSLNAQIYQFLKSAAAHGLKISSISTPIEREYMCNFWNFSHLWTSFMPKYGKIENWTISWKPLPVRENKLNFDPWHMKRVYRYVQLLELWPVHQQYDCQYFNLQFGCRLLYTFCSQHTQGIIKGYCTISWINCGMAKSLAPARACEGLLTSDLAIPQLIHELMQ